MSAGEQSGTWRKIAPFYNNKPARADIFTAWLDHGVKPEDAGYAYAVLPNYSKDDMVRFADHPLIQLIQNDERAQVIQSVDENFIAGAFYEPTVIKLAGGQKIHVQTPGLLVLEQKGDSLKITVADPTQKETVFKIQMDGQLSGNGAIYHAENQYTNLAIQLPAAPDQLGDSTSKSYSLFEPHCKCTSNFNTQRKTF